MLIKQYIFFMSLLAASVWMVACGSEEAIPQETEVVAVITTQVPPTATPVPPTATPIPPPAAPKPSEDQFTVFSVCDWSSRFSVSRGMIFLSATDAPSSKSVKSLNLDFIPATASELESSVINNSLGFAYHQYSRTKLDLSKSEHIVDIPQGKVPFKIDLNIVVSGEGADGNACSTTIYEEFSRSDDYYPSADLTVPSNAIADRDKYKPFVMPSVTAQGVMLATSQGNWNGSYEKVSILNTNDFLVRKPEISLKVGLFGDVGPKDYESIRDYIEVLAVIAPGLDIAWANHISEVNLPIHFIACTDVIKEADRWCNTEGPSGAFSDQRISGDGSMLTTGYGYIRISGQRSNRHTLIHEFGHAMGLWHSEVGGTSMGPGHDQASYWAAQDLMTIATIHNSAVKHGQTRDEIQAALNIPDDEEWQNFLNDPTALANAPDSVWVDLDNLLKVQAEAAR